MRKKDLKCEQCGQTWAWPSDMERAGLCVNCAAVLSCWEHERAGFLERLIDPAICMNADQAGGRHVWDGEPVEFGWGGSATCSRCGALAINVDQFAAP
jgi:hypothetical protein